MREQVIMIRNLTLEIGKKIRKKNHITCLETSLSSPNNAKNTTIRIILRSKTRGYELEEKNNKFLLSLKKRNKTNSHVKKLIEYSENEITSQCGLLGIETGPGVRHSSIQQTQKPITRSLGFRYWGWFLRFSG